MDEGIHTLATNETKLDKTAFNKIASLDNFDLRRKDLNWHSVMGTEVTKHILRFYVRRHGVRNKTLSSDAYHDTY